MSNQSGVVAPDDGANFQALVGWATANHGAFHMEHLHNNRWLLILFTAEPYNIFFEGRSTSLSQLAASAADKVRKARGHD